MDDDTTTNTALAAWLAERIGAERVEIVEFAAPRSGYSAETSVFRASVTIAGATTDQRFVLRKETPDPPVYPVQAPGLDAVEIAIQYRAMEAISAHTSAPIAPLVGYEDDVSVLGTQFFVMRHVAGEVPIENPMYTAQGFFFDAAPADRERLLRNGLRALAEVHRMDWTTAGLDWLVPTGVTPGTDRQMAVWEQYAEIELAGRHHPLLEQAFAWLHANQPDEPPLGFSWGDPRPGNIIWQDFEIACLTDFEACSIAPAEHDLGWWLMFDRWSHETMGLPRLEGEPTRAEQAAFYAECLGRPVGDPLWWEVFAAARYCAIVVRVMNRTVARGLMPADQTIWLDNPATTCLQQLMHELS